MIDDNEDGESESPQLYIGVISYRYFLLYTHFVEDSVRGNLSLKTFMVFDFSIFLYLP